MKVGDQVALFSHDGFRRFCIISKSRVPSTFDGTPCYETTDGTLFYLKPELGTGRHYNVGNKAFWIVGAKARGGDPAAGEW
jgi:hypothetical protein